MTHTRSSAKDLRRTKKRTERNRGLKAKMRTSVKKAKTSLETGVDDSQARVKEALKTLDKMVTKGVIHRNAAARKKSRLMKHQNNLLKGIKPVESKPKKTVEVPVEQPQADTESSATS